ncbi:PRKR-interacting protein 1 homolog [Episyrphus balteatus]|uniref:PRKR-interacting protein 1 homolog n=1 Tax=Episyrphus balteatus TaxID=286459 RepID=UPI00248536AB|nr:PRKR-interacting protein 1 homolog [Episyrphus balteatus]
MQNLVERTSKHKKDNADNDNEEEKKKRPIIKSATDLQRLKLEKLMKNPDKPVIIPESPREKDYMQTVPSFVRNVMGSSAGAGSGEFHVYRHLRRKEYARQKCIHAKSIREQLDDEYQSKLEKNRLEADAKTAKKRAKRLKKKQRAKKPKVPKSDETEKPNDTDTDDDEDEDEEALEKKENDSEICQDTAGPAPKDDINDIRNEDEPIQNETLNTCLNTDKSSQNNQEKNENDKQISTETKEQAETEDVDGTEKQKVDVEDKATDEQIKEPKLLES